MFGDLWEELRRMELADKTISELKNRRYLNTLLLKLCRLTSELLLIRFILMSLICQKARPIVKGNV